MSSGKGVVERTAGKIPLTGQELRVRDCLRDLGVDFRSHAVFALFEDFKVTVNFLIEDCVVLECMYSRCKSKAYSWFRRNGAYIGWKFKQMKKQQRQVVGSGVGGEGEEQKNNTKNRGEFLCVAFFEAPNYYREKELPELLKKCISHADAIFSSIRDLKEYLKKQLHLPKPVTPPTAIAQQSQNGKSETVKLEHFLNSKTRPSKKSNYRSCNLDLLKKYVEKSGKKNEDKL